jgi:hypothetical protein
MTSGTISKEAQEKRADAKFKKQERTKDGKQGAADYETAARAVAAKTARLRALRLAKEAADRAEAAANPVKPATPKKKRAARSTSQDNAIADAVADPERRD